MSSDNTPLPVQHAIYVNTVKSEIENQVFKLEYEKEALETETTRMKDEISQIARKITSTVNELDSVQSALRESQKRLENYKTGFPAKEYQAKIVHEDVASRLRSLTKKSHEMNENLNTLQSKKLQKESVVDLLKEIFKNRTSHLFSEVSSLELAAQPLVEKQVKRERLLSSLKQQQIEFLGLQDENGKDALLAKLNSEHSFEFLQRFFPIEPIARNSSSNEHATSSSNSSVPKDEAISLVYLMQDIFKLFCEVLQCATILGTRVDSVQYQLQNEESAINMLYCVSCMLSDRTNTQSQSSLVNEGLDQQMVKRQKLE